MQVELTDEILGKADVSKRLALDENGNVIGFVDEDGTVRDFEGNLIGYVGEDGTINDVTGNVIGILQTLPLAKRSVSTTES